MKHRTNTLPKVALLQKAKWAFYFSTPKLCQKEHPERYEAELPTILKHWSRRTKKIRERVIKEAIKIVEKNNEEYKQAITNSE